MIVVDLDIAKNISHNVRRNSRAELFKPLDIQSSIPTLAEVAEAERSKIRKEYALHQSNIDAAESEEELRTLIAIMTEEQTDHKSRPWGYLFNPEEYDMYLKGLRPLTRRQFRLALIMNGFDLEEVKQLILMIPDPMARQVALVEWEDSSTFERQNASLIAMVGILGLTEEQTNMMWEQAMTL